MKPNSWTVFQQWKRSNEDRYHVAQIGLLEYYAIFDGHGCSFPTAEQNEIHVVNYCEKYLHQRLQSDNLDTIKDTFVNFNNEMMSKGLRYGTCCTIVLLDREKKILYQINLGDSRSYILNKSNDNFLVTEDHNCRSEKERQRISDAGGFILNNKVNGILSVTRSFGDYDLKDVISVIPDIKVINIEDYDVVLLTSDAPFEKIYGSVFIKKFLSLYNSDADLNIITKKLGKYVLNKTTDDITIIVVNLK